MTGSELREYRRRLRLSQRAMALLLGIHWNSLARMERNEMAITESLSRLVRLVTHVARTSGLPKVTKIMKGG
jgi:transcriptional regulator with XRE-family HTH domain